jgi:hypothetical protein
MPIAGTEAGMPNFYYAAYSYLDEWMRKDRQFHAKLGRDQSGDISDESGAACLVEVAKYYGVLRTLRTNEEHPRLKAAYRALQNIEAINERTLVETVEGFTKTLAAAYRVHALSAASKFLWMRFRSPVLIYDSLVAKWLCKNGDYRNDGYANFRVAWMKKYQQYESEVRDAAASLKSVRRFTLAWEVSDIELESWTSSTWFLHRVFDHAMLRPA